MAPWSSSITIFPEAATANSSGALTAPILTPPQHSRMSESHKVRGVARLAAPARATRITQSGGCPLAKGCLRLLATDRYP